MGCTASVLEYDQQQEWGRPQYSVPVDSEARLCPKPSQAPEQSIIQSRGIREEKVDESFGEVFVDDELSKLNESERAMYDGSVDGCSKADYSVNESVATRLDISKSVATDEALYEDGSSESDGDVRNDDTPDEVALYPISVDGDEDLSKGDSLIASSMAPDPILNEESSSDGIRGMSMANTSTVPANHGDICFTPRSPEVKAIAAKRTISEMKGGNLQSFFPEPTNERTNTKPGDKSRSAMKTPPLETTCSLSRKSDKPKRRNQTGAPSHVASQFISGHVAGAAPQSLEKSKLREEIDRLRQQIQKLESKGLPASTSNAFRPPSELVLSIDDRKFENSFIQNEPANVDSTKQSSCMPLENFQQQLLPECNSFQETTRESTGVADEYERIDQCCMSLQPSQESALRIEVNENPGDLSHDEKDAKVLLTPTQNKSSIKTPQTEDARVCLGSERVQYSASTTEEEALFALSLNESQLVSAPLEAPDVDCDDTTANESGALTQLTATESFESAVKKLKIQQPVTTQNMDESKQEIENVPREENQNYTDDGAHQSQTEPIGSFEIEKVSRAENQNYTDDGAHQSQTEPVGSFSEKQCSKSTTKNSDMLQKPDAQEIEELSKVEWDDEAAFVSLLNADPWDENLKLDESAILHLIHCHPHYCSVKQSFEGFHGSIYPLHAICALGASLATVKKCYHAFPDAITKADSWVGTCLHYACSYRAAFPVVEYLAKKNPLALKAVNQFSRLPLHMACMFGADADVVAYLTRKYPGAAKKVDKLGMLPLHIACDSDLGILSPNLPVVEVLVDAYPEACLIKCDYGSIPLAICVSRNAPLPVLRTLIKARPDSLSETDQESSTPLHSALAAKAPLEVIRLLVDSDPSVLLTENNDNETPYDYGIKLKLDSAILNILETTKKSC